MQARQELVSPCRGSVDGTLSSILIFLLSTGTYRADVDMVHLLMRNSSRGGLLVLSSFSRRSPHEAPPHEGLLRWALVIGLPLGRSWAVEGAHEQVDRDTPVSRTPTVAPGSLARKRALLRERRVRGPQKLLGPPTARANAHGKRTT
jgi:hypothetical protein